MIEGCISDLKYCAESIFAYCKNVGYPIEEVTVAPINDCRFMVGIIMNDPLERQLYAEEIVDSSNLDAIIAAGRVRAELMVSRFHTKH